MGVGLGDVRAVYAGVDLTPTDLRPGADRRGAQRRLVIGSVAVICVAAVLAAQGLLWRTQLATEHERLVQQRQQLTERVATMTPIEHEQRRLIRRMAVTDGVVAGAGPHAMLEAIGQALPPDVRLRSLTLERTWQHGAADGAARSADAVMPVVAVELEAETDPSAKGEAALAELVAALAAVDQFEQIAIEPVEPGVGASAEGGDRLVRRLRMLHPLEQALAAMRGDDLEVARER